MISHGSGISFDLLDADMGAAVFTDFLPEGYVSDGSVDYATEIQAAIDSLMGVDGTGRGGVLYFPPGVWRADSQLVIRRESGSSYPAQPYLRLTGAGSSANGQWGVIDTTAATVLDLRVDASVAKIDTRGRGLLEIDHLVLADLGTSGATFIQTTNTTLHIHHCGFQGNTRSLSLGLGGASVNDALIFGGGDGTAYGGILSTSPFQGYGTVIDSCWFSQVKRAAIWKGAANGIQFVNNTVGRDCGSETVGDAALLLAPTAEQVRGNWIAGNLIEASNYTYGVSLVGSANSNFFIGNQIWDKSAWTTHAFNVGGGGNTFMNYTDSFGIGAKFNGGGVSNFFFDLANGGVENYNPCMRGPVFLPVNSNQNVAAAGAAGINNTAAVTHEIRAQGSTLTINAPSVNPGTTGQICWIRIKNQSGGAITTTWNAIYKMAAWSEPANGFSRTIAFQWDATNWIEISRTPADVPN